MLGVNLLAPDFADFAMDGQLFLYSTHILPRFPSLRIFEWAPFCGPSRPVYRTSRRCSNLARVRDPEAHGDCMFHVHDDSMFGGDGTTNQTEHPLLSIHARAEFSIFGT
jgi:hypothetical protein